MSLQGNSDSSCHQPNRQKYIYLVVVKDILAYHLLTSYPKALGRCAFVSLDTREKVWPTRRAIPLSRMRSIRSEGRILS